MSLAMKRLKNLGWLALVFLVAVLLYPLSLNVAALHSDLVRMDGRILETKREISFLQAEIRTRASVQQLEEWNQLLYGYAPPTADQFVKGEAALASFDGPPPNVKPVMVAVSTNGVAPSGVTRSSSSLETVERDKELVGLASIRAAAQPEMRVEQRVADNSTAEALLQSRTERLAKIDNKLLSDDFMEDMEQRAAKEQKRK